MGPPRRPGAPRSPAAALAASVASAFLPSPNPSRPSAGSLPASAPDRLQGSPEASDLRADCRGRGRAAERACAHPLPSPSLARELPQRYRGCAGLRRAGCAAGRSTESPPTASEAIPAPPPSCPRRSRLPQASPGASTPRSKRPDCDPLGRVWRGQTPGFGVRQPSLEPRVSSS